MSTASSAFPQLHALLGDGIANLPADIAQSLENRLSDHRPQIPLNVFNRLATIQLGDDVDGQPWDATLRPRTPHEMASLNRSLSGLSAVLELLHAAERDREEDTGTGRMEPFLFDGLILAARQLTHHAQDAVARTQ